MKLYHSNSSNASEQTNNHEKCSSPCSIVDESGCDECQTSYENYHWNIALQCRTNKTHPTKQVWKRNKKLSIKWNSRIGMSARDPFVVPVFGFLNVFLCNCYSIWSLNGWRLLSAAANCAYDTQWQAFILDYRKVLCCLLQRCRKSTKTETKKGTTNYGSGRVPHHTCSDRFLLYRTWTIVQRIYLSGVRHWISATKMNNMFIVGALQFTLSVTLVSLHASAIRAELCSIEAYCGGLALANINTIAPHIRFITIITYCS